MSPACWFKVRDEVYACAPPKNGGTSFYRSLFDIPKQVHRHNVYSRAVEEATNQGRGPWTPEQASEFMRGRFYIAIRSPIERFCSLWRDKCERLDPNMKELYGLTVDELLAYISMAPMANAHWMPQVAFDIWPNSNPVPYLHFQDILDLRRVHDNRTQPLILPDDITDKIVELYRADFDRFGYYW